MALCNFIHAAGCPQQRYGCMTFGNNLRSCRARFFNACLTSRAMVGPSSGPYIQARAFVALAASRRSGSKQGGNKPMQPASAMAARDHDRKSART